MHAPIEYNDGVPYDESAMRIEQCPRCHNTEFSSNAQYCRICGMDLYNRCDGMEADNYGNWYPNPEAQHYNPSNARFCETCGRPTFFYTQQVLCDYKDFKSDNDDSDDDVNRQLHKSRFQEIAAAARAEGYLKGNQVHVLLSADDNTGELPF